MICKQCLKTPRSKRPVLGRGPEPMSHRLRTVLCERCGSPLAMDETSDRLLRTLSHLAAFGLAAGGGPILQSGQGAGRSTHVPMLED